MNIVKRAQNNQVNDLLQMRQKFVLANIADLFYFRYLHIMSEMKLFLIETLRSPR